MVTRSDILSHCYEDGLIIQPSMVVNRQLYDVNVGELTEQTKSDPETRPLLKVDLWNTFSFLTVVNPGLLCSE